MNEYTYNVEGTKKYPSHIETEVIGTDLLRYIRSRSERLDLQLDEIYEMVVGDNGRGRYTHAEIIDRLKEYYDCYKYVVDNIYSKGEHIK
jgi:hypothetical protein|tara:strand:- start:207 stop:476 length:270 start_codon:yes stop_codon:yes gene_type:complete